MPVSLRTFGITIAFSTALIFCGPVFGQSAPTRQSTPTFDVDQTISDARKAFGEKRDSDAFALYLKAARTGNPIAQHDLAKMYAGGFGTKRDLKEAKRLGLLAAKQGVADAQNLVGLLSKSSNPDVRDLNDAVFWFQKAIVNGSADAQFNLGQMYLDGDGVRQDNRRGVALLEEAAQKGSITAHHRLSRIYHKGSIVPRDVTRAIRYAKTAARGGELEAAVMLSVAYANGYDVAKDIDESRKWMRIGATGKSVEELFKLAAHYARTRDGKLKRHPITIALLTHTAGMNHLQSIIALARISLLDEKNSEDRTRAIAMYEKAVALGHLEMTHEYASMYMRGTVFPKNLAKGIKLLGIAASGGLARSQVRLGILYYKNFSPKTVEKAERWFQLAADQGDAEGQYWLANMYYLEGRTEKMPAALELLRRSSEQEFWPATSRLGRFRFHGHPIPQHTEQGLRFLRAAANAGDANAQYDLGNALFYGTNIERNHAQAALWLQRAAAQHHPDALSLLSRAYFNGFGVAKDPTQGHKLAQAAMAAGSIDLLYPMAQASEATGEPRDLIEAFAMYSVVERYLGRKADLGNRAYQARAAVYRRLTDEERSRATERASEHYLTTKRLRTLFD
ncbi:MAG: TPR repeat protein [Paracoccaceae bacterium]|jgi:TPR repeat protein